jgi:mono/diheme cytochrome c family protein
MAWRLLAGLGCLLAGAMGANSILADDTVDFVRDVQPIFKQYCFDCHGPDTAEAGLRLSKRKSAFGIADSGHKPLVAGNTAESRLLHVLKGTDAEGLRMPPEDYGELEADELAIIERWIAGGAVWPADGDVAPDGPKHWSFVPPVKSEVKSQKSEGMHPIDAFVVDRLKREGLQLNPEADRHTLIRRVYLDLTGLPPSPQAVQAFVEDASPDAYEKMVDAALADPGYAERWARMWLDLARYADSKGWGSDPLRTIWRYRDWVIEAFQQNMPYDQFTIEQLAGDMLPDPTPNQILATAFHRNTMANDEGGTDDEEFRVAAVKDRAETTMQVWMGLTAGCAKCHSHKFDPITQREYYQLFAIFNQTEDADRPNEEPKLAVPTSAEKAAIAALESSVGRLREKLQATKASPNELPPPAGRFVRVQLDGPQRILSLAEVQVFSTGENVAIKGTATQSSTGFEGVAQRAIDDNTNGNYSEANSVTHTNEQENPWWEVDLGSTQTVERIVVWNRTDSELYHRLENARIQLLDEGRQLLWEHKLASPPKLSHTIDTQAASPAELELVRLESELESLKQKAVATPIMRELPADQQRQTFVMLKGNFLNPGPPVTAALPEEFDTLPKTDGAADKPLTRLEFAQWLMSAENPLTARVTVNRFWSQLFGRGLVESEEDFGTQGLPPSHPELLDWLAIEFRDNLKWDVKKLLKTIVMSQTYRQSSAVSPEKLEADPHNKLLARGPRHRLEAEMIRDQALAVSGLLSRKVGGPSVYPPQPAGLWQAAFEGTRTWPTSTGEDRYRRGIYTFLRRSVPYPSMATFDAPSREICTLRRMPTNTPLQAFVSLNDPAFVECAQALARRILSESSAEPAARAAYGLQLCQCRPAQPEQIEAIVKLVADQVEHFRAQPEAAVQLATDPLGPVPEGMDPAELAAWTVAANVLLNIDGVLTKN